MRLGSRVITFLLISIAASSSAELRRDDFPQDFVFGAGTSAYQVEGAAAEDGRTPSVWDTFAHSGRVSGKSDGDMACDEYHKYKEDVKLMKDTGLEAYRFSISWSRLIPNGRGNVNLKALEYYNNLINELMKHGIQPHVTLFHYDLPQVLEDEYRGWLNSKIVEDFTAYADICFREFGDRVAHWTTLNEPNALALGGYDVGNFPPGRCSYPFGSNCSKGNSIFEPYIVAHNCLLAHSSVVTVYKNKYQAQQQGLVGLNIFIYHFVPLTHSEEDKIATERAKDFFTGWFIKPLVYGDYPDTMKKLAGHKIPIFSKNQSKQLVGAFDFIGVNYYAALCVKDDPTDATMMQRDLLGDMLIKLVSMRDEEPRPEISTAIGLQGVLEYLKQDYRNPLIYIHENGYPLPHNEILDDTPRVKYLSAHLESLLDALKNGSNTQGYFMWSFLDLFELSGGYENSYGMYYVSFGDKELKRYPKLSAHWYSEFLKRGRNDIIKEKASQASIKFYYGV